MLGHALILLEVIGVQAPSRKGTHDLRKRRRTDPPVGEKIGLSYAFRLPYATSAALKEIEAQIRISRTSPQMENSPQRSAMRLILSIIILIYEESSALYRSSIGAPNKDRRRRENESAAQIGAGVGSFRSCSRSSLSQHKQSQHSLIIFICDLAIEASLGMSATGLLSSLLPESHLLQALLAMLLALILVLTSDAFILLHFYFHVRRFTLASADLRRRSMDPQQVPPGHPQFL